MFSHYGPLCTTVYNLTKPVGSELNGDVSYYSERLAGETGPILEIGVGTGRMLVPLLTEGFQMVGIDNSPDMLKQCEINLEEANLAGQLFTADFCQTPLTDSYSAIIIPTSTFNLITDYTQALAGLKNIYHSLQPGGRLILDLDLPFYPEVGEVQTSSYPLDSNTGITLEVKTLNVDWLAQVVVQHLKYEKWQAGNLLATELQNLTLKWYGLEEFKLILTSIGFTNISVTADYDYLEQPTDSNQTLTFEASKPTK